MWEQWRPELPLLGSGVTELARQYPARFRAWREDSPVLSRETGSLINPAYSPLESR